LPLSYEYDVAVIKTKEKKKEKMIPDDWAGDAAGASPHPQLPWLQCLADGVGRRVRQGAQQQII
jgi:hypothetical protein